MNSNEESLWEYYIRHDRFPQGARFTGIDSDSTLFFEGAWDKIHPMVVKELLRSFQANSDLLDWELQWLNEQLAKWGPMLE